MDEVTSDSQPVMPSTVTDRLWSGNDDTISNLAVGEATTVSTTMVISRGGLYQFQARIDPEGAIPEFNTDNNIAEASLSVLPDLSIRSVSIMVGGEESFIVSDGATVQFECHLANNGHAVIDDTFDLKLRVYQSNGDGMELGVEDHDASMAIGGKDTVIITWKIARSIVSTYLSENGTLALEVITDSGDDIREHDESNNEYRFNITIGEDTVTPPSGGISTGAWIVIIIVIIAIVGLLVVLWRNGTLNTLMNSDSAVQRVESRIDEPVARAVAVAVPVDESKPVPVTPKKSTGALIHFSIEDDEALNDEPTEAMEAQIIEVEIETVEDTPPAPVSIEQVPKAEASTKSVRKKKKASSSGKKTDKAVVKGKIKNPANTASDKRDDPVELAEE